MTWVSEVVPSSVSQLERVSCQSATSCLAVGIGASGPVQVGGAILTTSDGGTTWTSAAVPSDSGALEGVTCVPTTTICFVSGVSLDAVTNGVGVGGLLRQPVLRCQASGRHLQSPVRAPSRPPPWRDGLGHRVTSTAIRSRAIRSRAILGEVFAPAAAVVATSSPTTAVPGASTGGGQIFASGDGGSTWTEQVVPAQSAEVADL